MQICHNDCNIQVTIAIPRTIATAATVTIEIYNSNNRAIPVATVTAKLTAKVRYNKHHVICNIQGWYKHQQYTRDVQNRDSKVGNVQI